MELYTTTRAVASDYKMKNYQHNIMLHKEQYFVTVGEYEGKLVYYLQGMNRELACSFHLSANKMCCGNYLKHHRNAWKQFPGFVNLRLFME
jgi:hypothetical protein